MKLFGRTILAAIAASGLLAGAAAAHHGWDWTVDEQTKLEGVVREVYLGPPHATLKIEATDGLWSVDLAPPEATSRAGFVEGVVKVRTSITLVGNRSSTPNEKRMKAVRVTVGGKNY